jgi:hypothetical protein
METSHEFNVEGLERVAGGLNKVDTRMNPIINDIFPVGFILGFKIGIESRLDALENGLPTGDSLAGDHCGTLTCPRC